MDHRNRDVVDENCIHNDAGEHALSDKDKIKAWVEQYTRLLNVELVWPSNQLPEVPQMLAPSQCAHGPDPQSTQQNEMQQGCWPIWHHSWDAESCWWGRSWTDETTDRGCSHQTGRRVSFWTSIRAKVKPLTMAIIVVSDPQIKS